MDLILRAQRIGVMVNAVFLFALLSGLVFSPIAAAAEPVVGVVYPDIREPFRSVFISIAKGIGAKLGTDPQMLPLADSQAVQDVASWARSENIEVIVALGSRGPAISDALSDAMPVIVGAVHISPDLLDKRYAGVSLNPDPLLLLERLRTFAPTVRRVTVIYHRERESWMIDRAADTARRLGLELNAIPVDRLQEAVGAYGEVLASLRSGTDALWLSQDSAVLDEQAVLPMILREAWNRKLIVFSSNPGHVRRGVLFALYPDNYAMGTRLGAMTLEFAAKGNGNPKTQGLRVLRDISVALNVRTANHIGLRYPKEVLQAIDLVFPLM
ncbi:MAG: ABC transporter substrate binding protein [Gammaproteobacteria bacterium]|jgi:putative ABC transport system substrate-binding protein|nr:ABC transporter substrate binding protein [Gammaproteobacteria bacterium]